MCAALQIISKKGGCVQDAFFGCLDPDTHYRMLASHCCSSEASHCNSHRLTDLHHDFKHKCILFTVKRTEHNKAYSATPSPSRNTRTHRLKQLRDTIQHELSERGSSQSLLQQLLPIIESRRFGRLDCQSILLSMPTPQISWSSTAIVAPMPTKCSSLRKKQAHGYYNEYPGTLLKECTQNVFCLERRHPVIIHPEIIHPVIIHPVIIHPVIFHPVILHLVIFHPVILHPVIFHPVVFHPVIFHPAQWRVDTTRTPCLIQKGTGCTLFGPNGHPVWSKKTLDARFGLNVLHVCCNSWRTAQAGRKSQWSFTPTMPADTAFICQLRFT
eukprot:1161741-Pelagomonas_calceolata.AAC.21